MNRRLAKWQRQNAAPRRRSVGNRVDAVRRLGFELLEHRRLLATITVNTLVDENNGIAVGGISLREAVAAAAPNDAIDFSVTGTINLTSTGTGHIVIDKHLTIQGPGTQSLTVNAYDPDVGGTNNSNGKRVFFVSGSGTLNVTIRDLTLANGDPDISDEDNTLGGGAIHNEENLLLLNCVLTGNYAPGGGAVANAAGALTLTDCTISGNAAKDGGGVIVDGGGVTITGSTFSGNQVTNSGGGLLVRGRTVLITDSTISGNTAEERGGGLYSYQGNLLVAGSTISGNVADADNDQVGHGGGIYNLGGGLTVTNSTISGNSAGEDGGGIFSNTAQTIAINHSTVVGNSVTNHTGNNGGGIRSIDPASLNHTIVAGNLKGTAREDVSGSFDALYSLIGDRRSATVLNLGGSLIGTTSTPINPLLGPLANNGGATMTHGLLAGSPAIDSGDPAAVAGSGGVPVFDQRGMPRSRIQNGRIDMGAIESPPPGPALPGDYNLNHVVDAADYVLWRKTLGAAVAPYSGADGSGNAQVDGADYDLWRMNFGNVLAAGSSAATAADQTTEPRLAGDETLASSTNYFPLVDVVVSIALSRRVESADCERGSFVSVDDMDNELLPALSARGEPDRTDYRAASLPNEVDSEVETAIDTALDMASESSTWRDAIRAWW